MLYLENFSLNASCNDAWVHLGSIGDREIDLQADLPNRENHETIRMLASIITLTELDED